jgi:hypothetical protein
MPVEFERAVAYIREHSDEFARAQLELLLGEGSLLSHQQQQRFLAGQRADGGWAPAWAADYSSLDATCFQLSRCEGLWIGLRNSPCERAVEFLRSRQRAEGSWEEEESVATSAPAWAKPGVLASRLYITANCAWLLANAALSGFVTRDIAAVRGGAYLEQHLAPDGSLPSFLQAHWLTAGLWIRLGHDELAYRVLDHLATCVTSEVPSSSLAWMLTTLSGLGIPPEHPFAHKAAELLISQQRADGSWEGENGAEGDPYITVEALRGLIQWAAI